MITTLVVDIGGIGIVTDGIIAEDEYSPKSDNDFYEADDEYNEDEY